MNKHVCVCVCVPGFVCVCVCVCSRVRVGVVSLPGVPSGSKYLLTRFHVLVCLHGPNTEFALSRVLCVLCPPPCPPLRRNRILVGLSNIV